MLAVNELRTWYAIKKGVFARTVGVVKALDDVSFTLKSGETLGVVGESGSGKSTLARTILKLVRPRSGNILFEGQDIFAMNSKQAAAYRRAVQVVFQDPYASLNPRHTILDALTEAALLHGIISKDERVDFAVNLLRDVGMPEDALNRYPYAFSGGQRQRICIAQALSLNPRLLLLDEAVSALDLSVRAQVLNLLMDLREKRNLTYLFITHDLSVVRHLANRIIVMRHGKIVESGDCAEVMENPSQQYTKNLIAAIPRIGGVKI